MINWVPNTLLFVVLASLKCKFYDWLLIRQIWFVLILFWLNDESVHQCEQTAYLTHSWRRPLSYRNQSIDLQSKSMDWVLYDNDLRHERVKWYYELRNDYEWLCWNNRSSYRWCSIKKGALKNFTGNHLYWILFLIKLQAWEA